MPCMATPLAGGIRAVAGMQVRCGSLLLRHRHMHQGREAWGPRWSSQVATGTHSRSELRESAGAGGGSRCWKERESRRAFLDEVAQRHGFDATDMTGWKKVVTRDVQDMGGTALLQHYYKGSLFAALSDLYPECDVTEAKCRTRVPHGYWKSRENRFEFLEHVRQRFGVKEPGDWQRVRTADVKEMGGGGLLNQFASFHDLLRDVYGHGDDARKWDLFECRASVPNDFWSSQAGILEFLERVKKQLDVRKKEDWYRVSVTQVTELKGAGLLRKMRLVDALRIAYPTETWDESQFRRSQKKAEQRGMHLRLRELFLPKAADRSPT